MTARVVALLAAAVLAAGCARAGESAGGGVCAPAGAASGPVSVDVMEGAFRLTLVNEAGDTVHGELRLRPQLDSLRTTPGDDRVRVPLMGTAAIDLAAVGAVSVQGLDSSDPRAPGIAVVQAPDQVVVRFGSANNRYGERAFDSGTMALFVVSADADGFRGRWISSVELTRVSGHFCATRTNGD